MAPDSQEREFLRPISLRLPGRAAVRGFPSPATPCQPPLYSLRAVVPAHPANNAAAPMLLDQRASSLFLYLAEFFFEFRGSPSHVQPVKKSIRRLQPDAKPFPNFLFFFPLSRVHFAISR